MRIKKRILIYIILFVAYWLLLLGTLALADYYDDIYTAIIISFSIFNIIYAFVFLKLNAILNIITSIIIACIGLFLAVKIMDNGFYPHNVDPYGMATAVSCYALFSIIIWEIAYQLKVKYNAR